MILKIHPRVYWMSKLERLHYKSMKNEVYILLKNDQFNKTVEFGLLSHIHIYKYSCNFMTNSH